MSTQSLKCVVVGDEEAGKVKLLQSMCKVADPSGTHQRTIYEGFPLTVTVDKLNCVLSLWDTSGQEEYQALRQLSYKDTDLFLICFSLVHPTTYYSVQETVRLAQGSTMYTTVIQYMHTVHIT